MLGCLADWMLGCVDAGFGYPDARMLGCLDARMRGCLAARIVFSPDAATFPNPAAPHEPTRANSCSQKNVLNLYRLPALQRTAVGDGFVPPDTG